MKISALLKYLDEKNIRYEIKDEKLNFPGLGFANTDYKIINDKIKKNYRDAMKKLKTLDKSLHSYFSEHVRSEGGAFIYEPPEGIDWHLD
jgi:hypothetical protein